MLPKLKRLSTTQFDEVFKKGRVIHSPLFVMKAIIGTKDTRYSAVSSKKNEATASKRNASRRKIYAALSHMVHIANQPSWVICVAKKSLMDIDQSDIEADIQHSFVKYGIIE